MDGLREKGRGLCTVFPGMARRDSGEYFEEAYTGKWNCPGKSESWALFSTPDGDYFPSNQETCGV
jgi:hypothetical protein